MTRRLFCPSHWTLLLAGQKLDRLSSFSSRICLHLRYQCSAVKSCGIPEKKVSTGAIDHHENVNWTPVDLTWFVLSVQKLKTDNFALRKQRQDWNSEEHHLTILWCWFCSGTEEGGGYCDDIIKLDQCQDQAIEHTLTLCGRCFTDDSVWGIYGCWITRYLSLCLVCCGWWITNCCCAWLLKHWTIRRLDCCSLWEQLLFTRRDIWWKRWC